MTSAHSIVAQRHQIDIASCAALAARGVGGGQRLAPCPVATKSLCARQADQRRHLAGVAVERTPAALGADVATSERPSAECLDA